ncbi:MAG TPA: Gp49 family protein [Burkholderiaceae bacterium]|nr:Gp49 family protein [Burkholderiaceae bacterium]
MPADESSIEKSIQAKGLTAPRITPADIDAQIASEHYFTALDGVLGAYKNNDDVRVEHYYAPDQEVPRSIQALGCLTFCVLVLRNGFTVTGESACASPENFDPEIGRQIAKRNARDKIWSLEGYQLRTRLHEQATINQ